MITRLLVVALALLTALVSAVKADSNTQASVEELLLKRFDENRDGKLDFDEGLVARSRLRHLLLDESERKIIIEDWRDDVRGILEAFDESKDGSLDAAEKNRAQAELVQLLPEFQPRKSDAHRSAKPREEELAAEKSVKNRESNNRQGYANQNYWGRYGGSPMNNRMGRYGTGYGSGYRGGNYGGYGNNQYGNNRNATFVGSTASQRAGAAGLSQNGGRFGRDPVQPNRGNAGGNRSSGFSFPGIRGGAASAGLARSEQSVPDQTPFPAHETEVDSGPIDGQDVGDALSEDYDRVADSGKGGNDSKRDRKQGTGGVSYNPNFNPTPNF